MADDLKIIVLEGDETGQELLEQAIRVLDPDVTGAASRARQLRPLAREPPRDRQRRRHRGRRGHARGRLRAQGRDVTPEGKDDVGSPNRILREEVDGKVIIRTGRRIPGVVGPVSGVHFPISVVRMAVEDAYGAKQWREGTEDADDEVAYRTEKITRSTCRAVAEYAFRTAERTAGGRLRRAEVDRLPRLRGDAQGGDGPRRRAPPDVEYRPVLIDATYAGLISGAAETPLVIPALNRDGDCLSDLVLPMFGSIAGAESVLLAFDDDHEIDVAMAEAPHGTAPSLLGKNLANPMAMILACAALLSYAHAKGIKGADRASRAIYESVLETIAGGLKTIDLGGHATTSEFTDAVIEKVRTKVDIWASLGS